MGRDRNGSIVYNVLLPIDRQNKLNLFYPISIQRHIDQTLSIPSTLLRN
jgi:hypothetical protein